MLRAVSEWAAARKIPAQVSLEARMGCGYGACVGCTIEVNETLGETLGDGTILSPSPSGRVHLNRGEVCEGVDAASAETVTDGSHTIPESAAPVNGVSGGSAAYARATRLKICKDGPVFPSEVIKW
jgi:hypothetical protein